MRREAFRDLESDVIGEAGFEVRNVLFSLKGEARWNARADDAVDLETCLMAEESTKGRRSVKAML